MDFDFKGKRAVVTGATRGIGRATIRLLHELGATVIAVCNNQAYLDELSNEIPGVIQICVDVSDWDKTREALSNCGPVDFLVNNVGVGFFKPFLSVTANDLQRTSSVNLEPTFNISQIVAEKMIEKGQGGAIVNIASVAGLGPGCGFSVYGCLKGATIQLTKTMALELAPLKIRVNSVSPGLTRTDATQFISDDKDVLGKYLSDLPIPTVIEPEEIAKSVCFLLSHNAKVITGIDLPVDAGRMLQPNNSLFAS